MATYTLYWSSSCPYSLELLELLEENRALCNVIHRRRIEKGTTDVPEFLRLVPTITIEQGNSLNCQEGENAFVFVARFVPPPPQRMMPQNDNNNPPGLDYNQSQAHMAMRMQQQQGEPIIPIDYKKMMSSDKGDLDAKIAEASAQYTPSTKPKAPAAAQPSVRPLPTKIGPSKIGGKMIR